MTRRQETIATFFYIGRVPRIPGTIASFAATLWVGAVACAPAALIWHLIILGLLIVAGQPSAQAYAEWSKQDDPSQVVIDEVLGIFVTFVQVAASWKSLLAGFVLFRVFDIWKPFPIRYFDRRLKNGFGVMFDDLLAAFYAVIVLKGALWVTMN